MSDNGQNLYELEKDEFDKLIKNKSDFLLTGTKLFFEQGKDTDFVLTEDKWKEILGYKADFDYQKWVCYKYITEKGKSFDFIVVRNEKFSDWELATKTACILIKESQKFREWFKKKLHRQRYFSAYIYS